MIGRWIFVFILRVFSWEGIFFVLFYCSFKMRARSVCMHFKSMFLSFIVMFMIACVV